jgi:drug/metabolite transporter (DMT)-like permease
MRWIATLVAATFLMGSSFVAGKILLTAGWPPLLLVGWRFLVAALATLPLVRIFDGPVIQAIFPADLRRRDGALIAAIGLLQTTAVMSLLFLAMQSISASTAAILLFTNPIWVAVLGRLFLDEPLHWPRLAGLVLGIVGVALALGVGTGQWSDARHLTGEFIGLAAALCWAVATVINKRAQLPIGTWALSFWQMLVGSIAALAIGCILGEHWPQTTNVREWAWFFWLAIPASTGSFGLWFLALARGGATASSGYLFLAPLFAVIVSLFILGTTLSWSQASGGVLIGFALWAVNREPPARSGRID